MDFEIPISISAEIESKIYQCMKKSRLSFTQKIVQATLIDWQKSITLFYLDLKAGPKISENMSEGRKTFFNGSTSIFEVEFAAAKYQQILLTKEMHVWLKNRGYYLQQNNVHTVFYWKESFNQRILKFTIL